MTKKIKKKKLNDYTEKKNSIPPVQVIKEAKIIGEVELPETKAIVPIKEFAMPLASVEEVKEGVRKIKELFNALVDEGDIVMIENKPHGKKSAINKINRFLGVSTEVLRSFMEENTAIKDYWSKGFRKVILVHKDEKYLVAKAWVKAILPNGQFCTRGGAASETERRFAHIPHDLLALSETRAMKNASANLAAFIDFELIEENEGEQKPKTYKPKPNQDQGYKHSAVVNPKMPASPKQKEFIQILIDKLRNDYELEIILEKPIEGMNKGECADLINKLIARGKEAKKNQSERIRKEIPVGEPPTFIEPGEAPPREMGIDDGEIGDN